ncbi:MAG TPA: hypothetical protein VF708_19730 [Pyrinomonadaceae bacterium]|jgi:hypothetical protein
MATGKGKNGGGQSRLLDRLLKAKPEFKPFKFEMSVELHERLEKLQNETGLSKEAINEGCNYAMRQLVTRLEREAKQGSAGK